MKIILVFLFAILTTYAFAGGGGNTPEVYNLTLTSANTQYSATIKNNTSDISIQSRTAADFNVSNVPNGVMGSNYYTVKSGTVYKASNINVNQSDITQETTLYFASANAGQVVEIMYWN